MVYGSGFKVKGSDLGSGFMAAACVERFPSFHLLLEPSMPSLRLWSSAHHQPSVQDPFAFSHSSSFFVLASLELSDTKSMSLEYEPSSEPLHISVKELSLATENW